MDTEAKVCVIRTITDEIVNEPYDHLVLAPGSVTRTFDIPGLDRHACGMKTLAEAAYIRDHVIAQLDLADASAGRGGAGRPGSSFVVVGGGYAGTETAACLQRLTDAAVKRYPRLDPTLIKWHLVDIAPKLMPELGDKLGRSALEILRGRGIEVSLGVSVAEAGPRSVTLTDGRVLPSRTLIWTAGVTASPLIATLDAETVARAARGRRRLEAARARTASSRSATPPPCPTSPRARGRRDLPAHRPARHAAGPQAADNVIAVAARPSRCGRTSTRTSGSSWTSAARTRVSKPLGIELRGLPAQAVARGYHLAALRTGNARGRTIANWLFSATTGNDFVRTGFASRGLDTLSGFEGTKTYLSHERIRELTATAAHGG